MVTDPDSSDVKPCFEAYESCRETGQIDLYEKYMFQNRTVGTMCAIFAFGPLIVFWSLIWPWDEELEKLFIESHP